MSYIIESPFPSFNDTDGSPLNNGNVYVGSANLNPVTDPIPVYWDAALTQPAAQPIRTINGYLSRNGSPGRIYTNFITYSFRVTNNKGVQVFSDLNYKDPSSNAGSTYQQVITAIAGQTVFNLSRTYIPGTNNLFIYRNGLRLIVGQDYNETGYSQVTLTAGADNGDEFVFDIGYNYDTAANIDAQDVTYKLPAMDSVFTNVEEKLSQIINVKDFGAVGDGTTDDTAAFTAAAAYSSPVQVSVPVGTYLLNSSPVASSSVSWLVDSGATFTGAGSLTSSGAKYLPLVNIGAFVTVTQFGAVGNNVADDSDAINSAIAYCNSLTIPVALQFPSGFYKITKALTPITSPTVLVGDSFRGSILFPQGNFDVIKFTGAGSRQYGGGIQDLTIDCQGMTGGIAVTLDWTQDFTGSFLLANAWNGVYVRQSGNAKFQSITIDKARGDYCFKAFGSNVSRNGQNDQCDAISFESDSTFTGTYIPGGATPTTTGVILDGRVHTVSFGNLRCLNLLRGFVCLNTPALTQRFVPSFIYGNCLETENTYAEGVLLIAANVFQTGLFVATAVTESGVKLSNQTTRININGCNIESCYKSGIVVDGTIDASISDPAIFRNNTYAGHPSGFSAIEILSGDNIAVFGGRCGKPPWDSYTEQQEWGIINVGATNVRATGVDLRNNYSGPSAGDIYFSQCPGSTVIAPSTPSVGASPWTYTAGATQEAISVNGGTVSQIAVQGVPLFTQTNQLFILQPNQSAVITYSSAPTVRSLKLVG